MQLNTMENVEITLTLVNSSGTVVFSDVITNTSTYSINSVTIRATNTGGSTDKIISITVEDERPSSLSFANSPFNWTKDSTVINETPSRQTIQALEKTRLLCIEKIELENLYYTIPKLERAFRIITENMLIAIQRKDEVYMKKTSKSRYFNLVKQIPNISQRVPQYMIASYLNISPEYLSEIRKHT